MAKAKNTTIAAQIGWYREGRSCRCQKARDMISRCKQDVTEIPFIFRCIEKCIKKKRRRNDVVMYLAAKAGVTKQQMRTQVEDIRNLSGVLLKIAGEMSERIRTRTVPDWEIRTRIQRDQASGKLRELGIQCIEHQLYEYVAVEAMLPMLRRKIGQFQMASYPCRGQVVGKNAIRTWIKRNPKGMRMFWKADIRHCYGSISHDILFRMLDRDLQKNQTLLYLAKHLIGQFKKGLSIGSYVSQWMCNYFLSHLYRYIRELTSATKRRGKIIKERMVTKVMFFMDDIVVFGSSQKHLKKAAQLTGKFCRENLGLQIKSTDILEKFHYVTEDGRIMGRLVDFMGFRIYRSWVTIRRRNFLTIRRCFARVKKKLKKRTEISTKMLKSLMARWGWVKNSNSRYIRKKYSMDSIIMLAGKILGARARGKHYIPGRRALYEAGIR